MVWRRRRLVRGLAWSLPSRPSGLSMCSSGGDSWSKQPLARDRLVIRDLIDSGGRDQDEQMTWSPSKSRMFCNKLDNSSVRRP